MSRPFPAEEEGGEAYIPLGSSRRRSNDLLLATIAKLDLADAVRDRKRQQRDRRPARVAIRRSIH
ncbi:hypothetical protein [Marisediminicola senii]|uniref:hypothetical protein n=1 Tax=Marisediminicola senii TaxID=2711233 RepID=UPI0013EDA1A7|nr:hypothetical protein [Marisediminicola senii]